MGVRTHIWRHEIKGAKVSFFIVMINNPSPGWGAAIYINKPTISRNCSQPPATIFWWFFVIVEKGFIVKRFLMLPVLIFGGFCASGAYGDYTKNGTYCVIDYSVSGGQCYWCRAGGDTAAGNCKKGYAGCMSTTEKYVNVGSVNGGWWCSSNGFCKLTCDDVRGEWRDMWNAENVQIYYKPNDCDCILEPDYTKLRCASGYYGTPTQDSMVCHKCPEYKNGDGTNATIYSEAGNNRVIDDCFLWVGDKYSDTSGGFSLVGMCYYGDNPTNDLNQYGQ